MVFFEAEGADGVRGACQSGAEAHGSRIRSGMTSWSGGPRGHPYPYLFRGGAMRRELAMVSRAWGR
jgi:hypothetical protein